MRYLLPLIVAVSTLSVTTYYSPTATAEGFSFNLMSSDNPEDIVSINWAPVAPPNPFAESLTYEIWHNHALLDTVGQPQYKIRLKDLNGKHGCISIRAVRGSEKSEWSAPACFLVRG